MRIKTLLFAISVVSFFSLNAQGLKDNLLFHYPFDGDMKDMSAAAKDGTINGPTFADESKFGKSIMFDGVDDYLTSPAEVFKGATAPFTFCVWASFDTINNSTTPPNRGNILQQEDAGGALGRTILFGSYETTLLNNTFKTYVGGKGLGSTTHFLTQKTWYHVAVVGNPTNRTRKVYVNGALVANDSAIVTAFEATTGALTWGRAKLTASATNSWFKGKLDDAAMFNIELTEAQIKMIMDGGVNAVLTKNCEKSVSKIFTVSKNGTRMPIISTSKAATLNVYSIAGQKVMSQSLAANQSVSINLKSGQYIATLNCGGVSESFRISIQ